MHSPRLCIDGRGSAEFALRGLMNDEVIDQLVSAGGDEGIGTPWIDKHRTVLLSHPVQVFTGQLKRFDTKVKVRKSPYHFYWENRFVREAQLSGFHRFRPVDQILSIGKCTTITTLLPPTKALPSRLPNSARQYYVVPSESDSNLLKTRYKIAPERVFVVKPGIRRYAHFTEKLQFSPEGGILFITEPGSKKQKQIEIISKRFPSIAPKIISTSDLASFHPQKWMTSLRNCRVVFYLVSGPFDWAIPALEALFWGIPTVFPDENATLGESLKGIPLQLSRFLIDLPKIETLSKPAQVAREKLLTDGHFDSLLQAKQYRQVYEKLETSLLA